MSDPVVTEEMVKAAQRALHERGHMEIPFEQCEQAARDALTAALALSPERNRQRGEIIEECAKAAESWGPTSIWDDRDARRDEAAQQIAAAIRSLSRKPEQEG